MTFNQLKFFTSSDFQLLARQSYDMEPSRMSQQPARDIGKASNEDLESPEELAFCRQAARKIVASMQSTIIDSI